MSRQQRQQLLPHAGVIIMFIREKTLTNSFSENPITVFTEICRYQEPLLYKNWNVFSCLIVQHLQEVKTLNGKTNKRTNKTKKTTKSSLRLRFFLKADNVGELSLIFFGKRFYNLGPVYLIVCFPCYCNKEIIKSGGKNYFFAQRISSRIFEIYQLCTWGIF